VSNPLRHIDEASAVVQARKAQRTSTQLEFRAPQALEFIADDLTLIRAEMSAMRELLAMIQAKLR
jgi:hypothetical protein